jgi:carbohydrate-binding DOMON domain-containing protein
MRAPSVGDRPSGGASPVQRVRSAAVHPTEQGNSIVRIRFALALMVAGMLFAAGIASAQDTTTTDTLSDYTSTTPTVTQPKTTTSKGQSTPATDGQEESSVAPSVAAQPAGSAPDSLAFTGAEPLLLIVLGLALAGGTATLLVRDRRRSSQDR